MKKIIGIFLVSIMVTLSASGAKKMKQEPLTLIPYEFAADELTGKCEQAIASARNKLDVIASMPHEGRTFENTVEAMENVIADLSQMTTPLTFMAYVSTNGDLRDEAFACEEVESQFYIETSLRKDLYEAFNAFRKNMNDDFSSLRQSQRRLIELSIRDYKQSGLWLTDDKLVQLRALKKELSSLQTDFSKNLVENTNHIVVTEEELAGSPETFRNRLERTEDGNFKVTTKPADYRQFMSTVDSEEARRRLLISYNRRAYPENVKLLTRAINLRHQIATLLEYESWAAYKTASRMAKTPENVLALLTGLRAKLTNRNKDEIARLFELKQADDPSATTFEMWDREYYENKLKKLEYAVDEEEIRAYFPAHRVIQGTFDIYSTLLGLEYREVTTANTWHEQVKLFEIRDKASSKLIGYFHADLYPREGKYGHAAAFTLQKGRRLADGSYQKTISSIVANLNPPSEGTPSLMSHDEVETFFHEFGHIMHQTLTRAEYPSFSGTSVARDFVEAPSQMLENWVWSKEMLDMITGHYQDESKKMPESLVNKLLKLSQFNTAIAYTRQLYYGTLDFTLHSSGAEVDIVEVADQLRKEIIGIPNPANTAWIAGFGHLMGGYDAGYYGYLWSKVYAEDMFTRFQKEGLLNQQVGMEYRRLVLEKGSSKDEMELIRDFLGREPNQDAFLKKLGIE